MMMIMMSRELGNWTRRYTASRSYIRRVSDHDDEYDDDDDDDHDDDDDDAATVSIS